MSIATSIIPFGIGCIGTWVYTIYHHRQELHRESAQLEREQRKTIELEEEIVRLKREMRICGVITSSDERSKQENHSK